MGHRYQAAREYLNLSILEILTLMEEFIKELSLFNESLKLMLMVRRAKGRSPSFLRDSFLNLVNVIAFKVVSLNQFENIHVL